MRRRTRDISILLIMTICMLSAAILTIRRVDGILEDSYENDHRVVSGMISNAIDNSFLRPITVTETMSNERIMSRILDIETKEEAEQMEEQAVGYLTSIRDGFGYSMIYAVSDASKAYFSYNGISKYVDPEKDEQDLWYKRYVDSELPYVLDVDTDVTNNWTLSVFVNRGVYDDQNNLLGVCGVGVNMGELQSQLARFERIYDVKIDLVDKDGLIQVDTDVSKIEKEFIDVSNLGEYCDGECYYEVNDTGNRTITYMENLNWYLIVQNKQSISQRIGYVILPSIVSFMVGLCAVVTIMVLDRKMGLN